MIGDIEMSDTSQPNQIEGFLGRFNVFYRVYQESVALRDHAVRQVGYAVDLYGSDRRDPPLCPGDERSHEIFRGLYQVARGVMPEGGACRIDLDGFDASLHYLDGAKGPGSVQLALHIRHRDKFDGPLDTAQKRALDEVIARLEALGVHQAGDQRLNAKRS